MPILLRVSTIEEIPPSILPAVIETPQGYMLDEGALTDASLLRDAQQEHKRLTEETERCQSQLKQAVSLEEFQRTKRDLLETEAQLDVELSGRLKPARELYQATYEPQVAKKREALAKAEAQAQEYKEKLNAAYMEKELLSYGDSFGVRESARVDFQARASKFFEYDPGQSRLRSKFEKGGPLVEGTFSGWIQQLRSDAPHLFGSQPPSSQRNSRIISAREAATPTAEQMKALAEGSLEVVADTPSTLPSTPQRHAAINGKRVITISQAQSPTPEVMELIASDQVMIVPDR